MQSQQQASIASGASDIASQAPNHFTTGAQPFVRLLDDALSDLSDTALNDYITACAEQMVAAHRRYEAEGFFADAGERDSWWHAEALALRERGSRPHIVKAMEEARGLNGR